MFTAHVHRVELTVRDQALGTNLTITESTYTRIQDARQRAAKLAVDMPTILATSCGRYVIADSRGISQAQVEVAQ